MFIEYYELYCSNRGRKRKSTGTTMDEPSCSKQIATLASESELENDIKQDDDVNDADYDLDRSYEYTEVDKTLDQELRVSIGEDIQDRPWREAKIIMPWSVIVTLLACCRSCGEKGKYCICIPYVCIQW